MFLQQNKRYFKHNNGYEKIENYFSSFDFLYLFLKDQSWRYCYAFIQAVFGTSC